MKILSGALNLDKGEMYLENNPYKPSSPREAHKSGVTMIYQELSLALHLTVEQNITLGMEPNKFGIINREESRRKAKEVLNKLGHSEIRGPY